MWGNIMSRAELNVFISVLFIMAISGIGGCAVVINEVELNPPGNATKWVELYNNGEDDVDVSDWVVSIVNPPWIGPMPIPEGTVIPAKGYYVAEGSLQWGQEYSGHVTLVDAGGFKVDETHLITDDGDSDFTFGRFPNGVDTDQKSDWKLMKATPGSENLLSIRT
jgi:hypothetical protein